MKISTLVRILAEHTFYVKQQWDHFEFAKYIQDH